MILIKKGSSDIRSSDITPEYIYKQRRRFLGATGALAMGVAFPEWLSANTDTHVSEYSTDESLTPLKDITSYNNFYELGTSKSDPKKYAHRLVSSPWSITVEGECEKPGTLGLEDFLKPHSIEERIYRMRCVEGWSMVIPWEGVVLADVIRRFKPTSKAKYIAFESIHDPKNLHGQRRKVLDWPYEEGLRMDEAMNPLTILSTGLYGESLVNQNGAPIRLVVPWKYGFKSIKSVVKIRFTETQPETSWNKSAKHEYGFYSNVNPKVNHPRWSQRRERRIGELRKRKTEMFNGYGEQVAKLYTGMDLKKNF